MHKKQLSMYIYTHPCVPSWGVQLVGSLIHIFQYNYSTQAHLNIYQKVLYNIDLNPNFPQKAPDKSLCTVTIRPANLNIPSSIIFLTFFCLSEVTCTFQWDKNDAKSKLGLLNIQMGALSTSSCFGNLFSVKHTAPGQTRT